MPSMRRETYANVYPKGCEMWGGGSKRKSWCNLQCLPDWITRSQSHTMRNNTGDTDAEHAFFFGVH